MISLLLKLKKKMQRNFSGYIRIDFGNYPLPGCPESSQNKKISCWPYVSDYAPVECNLPIAGMQPHQLLSPSPPAGICNPFPNGSGLLAIPLLLLLKLIIYLIIPNNTTLVQKKGRLCYGQYIVVFGFYFLLLPYLPYSTRI